MDRALLPFRRRPPRWLAGLFDGVKDGEQPTNYEGLGAAAERAPAGSGELIFVPHIDGRLLPSQARDAGRGPGSTATTGAST